MITPPIGLLIYYINFSLMLEFFEWAESFKVKPIIEFKRSERLAIRGIEIESPTV